jgi:hypothetical protein
MKRNPKFFRTWKHRGEWAELAFMAEAASRGFNVAKPWGDSSRYDVAVENHGRFLRVQVKSTACRQGRSYACSVRPNLHGRPYKKNQFDFLAAYVVPEDVWYIIPARLVVHGRMGMVILSPSLPGHKYEPYLEAWHLLHGKLTRPARSNKAFDAAIAKSGIR